MKPWHALAEQQALWDELNAIEPMSTERPCAASIIGLALLFVLIMSIIAGLRLAYGG